MQAQHQAEQQTEYTKYECAKELMDRMKQQLGTMAGLLDFIIREIAGKCISKPEERLMAVVHALLTRYICCTFRYSTVATTL